MRAQPLSLGDPQGLEHSLSSGSLAETAASGHVGGWLPTLPDQLWWLFEVSSWSSRETFRLGKGVQGLGSRMQTGALEASVSLFAGWERPSHPLLSDWRCPSL